MPLGNIMFPLRAIDNVTETPGVKEKYLSRPRDSQDSIGLYYCHGCLSKAKGKTLLLKPSQTSDTGFGGSEPEQTWKLPRNDELSTRLSWFVLGVNPTNPLGVQKNHYSRQKLAKDS